MSAICRKYKKSENGKTFFPLKTVSFAVLLNKDWPCVVTDLLEPWNIYVGSFKWTLLFLTYRPCTSKRPLCWYHWNSARPLPTCILLLAFRFTKSSALFPRQFCSKPLPILAAKHSVYYDLSIMLNSLLASSNITFPKTQWGSYLIWLSTVAWQITSKHNALKQQTSFVTSQISVVQLFGSACAEQLWFRFAHEVALSLYLRLVSLCRFLHPQWRGAWTQAAEISQV